MPASPDAARRRLGWGVVGCGWVARDYGAPAIRASGNGRLMAVADPDAFARRALAPELSPERSHADLDGLLADPDVRAVYVATPNHAHAAVVASCAAAGRHVLCEKPMARDAAEAEGMVAACARAGVAYATAFDQRFHAAHMRLRGLIRDGALGRVTCARVRYACWCPADWAPGDWAHDNWRVDPGRAGGGAMIDLAPHGLDLLQHLLDDPITDVACFLQRRVFDYPVDDGGMIAGRTEGGALVSLSVAYNCPETFPRRVLEIVGDRGRALALDTMGQTPGGTLTLTDLDGRETPHDFAREDRSPFLNQIEVFSEAVLRGVPFPFPPETDLHTMRLLDAAAAQVTTRVAPPHASRRSEGGAARGA